MNAAGRVPCRCGATLILHPPRDRRPGSSPDLANADIVSLGYVIRVERTARAFDSAHNGLRDGLGLNTANATGGSPDPVRAARPMLLWPALGAAWDPRLAIPAAALGFGALSVRWLVRWLAGGGPLTRLLEFAATLVAYALVAAIATVTSAAAIHDVITENRPLSFGTALRTLLRWRRALLGSAVRETLLFALGAVSAVIAVASMIAVGDRGGTATVLSRASAPLQIIGMLTALASVLAMVGALLVHAGVTPYATGRMGVQILVETRRLWGRRGLVPARSFAPGLVAGLILALLLGAAVLSTIAAWDTVAAVIGDSNPAARGAGRQLGIDLLWALAGGVWTSFVGMAGLLGGYALGSGAPTEPVRAPDIITGTQQQMELPPEESPPPTRLAPADVVTGLVTLPPADDPGAPAPASKSDPTSSYSALPRSRS
ncbi:MAG: hypothetical protein QOI66_5336 [Myxococcales bacterium]|jgi:hypothetical protein|nr:hypothetical protein [Myxococcales bacterium]